MKILAIERETEGVEWDDTHPLLYDEAHCVYELYLSGTLREIYFTETKNAILILETDSVQTAQRLLDNLPLVKSQKTTFNVSELKPYTGYERLFGK